MTEEVTVRFPRKPTLTFQLGNRSATAGRIGWSEGQFAQNYELSIIVPVYNGSATIARVVEEMLETFRGRRVEVILVNDGSQDCSEEVCVGLVEKYGGRVILVQLSRNYGEHNAVMAGLRVARGQYAAIVDDDGQHPAKEVERMLRHAIDHELDVVYGRFRRRCHPWIRVLGSWFFNYVATYLLKKPRDLYLSSFKVLNRFAIDEIGRYEGPNPYVDGLVLRVTDRIDQIEVEHRPRLTGRSGYNLGKLLALWLGIVVEYSRSPLRAGIVGGFVVSLLGGSALVTLVGAGVVGGAAIGAWFWAAAIVAFIGGLQLTALGILGEYTSRTMLHHSGMPQHVMRSITTCEAPPSTPSAREFVPPNLRPRFAKA